MDDDGLYRIARRGEEVLVGTADDVAQAVAAGRILAGDLLFDPELDRWVFARDHALFTLPPAPVPPPVIEAPAPPPPPPRPSRAPLVVVAVAVLAGAAWSLARRPSGPATTIEVAAGGGHRRSGSRDGGVAVAMGAAGPKAGVEVAPGSMVAPTADDRLISGRAALARARALLAAPPPRPDEDGFAAMLAAVELARTARMQLAKAVEHFPEAEDDLDASKGVIDGLRDKFIAVCGQAHTARYCETRVDHPEWTPEVQEAVAAGNAAAGMNADQARAAWGEPTRTKQEGDAVRYCYGLLCGRSLKLERGVVTEVRP